MDKPLYKNNREAFSVHIGDVWLEKNRPILGNRDGICDSLDKFNVKPKRVLDVGCSNGWRMLKMREKYGCEVFGIEPSMSAIEEGNKLLGSDLILRATGDRIPFADSSFDMVVFGFSLYFIGPEDWMSVAAEANRVLMDGGYIVVNDYIVPRAYMKENAGYMGVYGYHHDWIKLWTWHPAYELRSEGIDQATSHSCAILQKKMANCIPVMGNAVPEA